MLKDTLRKYFNIFLHYRAVLEHLRVQTTNEGGERRNSGKIRGLWIQGVCWLSRIHEIEMDQLNLRLKGTVTQYEGRKLETIVEEVWFNRKVYIFS